MCDSSSETPQRQLKRQPGERATCLLRNRRIHTSPTYTSRRFVRYRSTDLPRYPYRDDTAVSCRAVLLLVLYRERPRARQQTAVRTNRHSLGGFFGSSWMLDGRGEIEKREVGRACSSLHPHPIAPRPRLLLPFRLRLSSPHSAAHVASTSLSRQGWDGTAVGG